MTPAAYRRIAWVALALLVLIVVTGAAVRLTGSGLGCTDWPNCTDEQFVAPMELHPMVEFVNRLVTGLVSAAVALAVLGSLRRAPGAGTSPGCRSGSSPGCWPRSSWDGSSSSPT